MIFVPVCLGFNLPVPAFPTAQVQFGIAALRAPGADTDTDAAGARYGHTASSEIFPSALLAVGYEGEQKVYSEEDKAAARNAGLFIVAASVLPSIWAQNELVWSKNKLDDARGKTKKRKK